MIGGNELLLRIPASPVPSGELTGQVSVTASGAPLVGAQILVQRPDGTWHIERTDSFGRAAFSLHSDIPMTVLCAAPGHRGRAVRDWRPSCEISIDMDPFPDGGSVVLMDGAGRVPNLRGRLNVILDELDRMYLYASKISIDGGKRQPLYVRLREALRLTDAYGTRLMVRFIEMVGRSALLEYWAASSHKTPRRDPNTVGTQPSSPA